MKKTTLTPAYGRDYKSKKAVLADLKSDKDFLLSDLSSRWDGKPINLSQLVEAGYTVVNVRYGKLRKIAVFTL